jgi:hypothetical protein
MGSYYTPILVSQNAVSRCGFIVDMVSRSSLSDKIADTLYPGTMVSLQKYGIDIPNEINQRQEAKQNPISPNQQG